MKSYQSKSISLRYDIKQDRVQWLGLCADNRLASIWISRRMLSALLLKLSQWLNKHSEQTFLSASKAKITKEKGSVHRFEHEAAQRQVPVVHEVVSKKQTIFVEFLLSVLHLTPLNKDSVKLVLSGEKNTYEIYSMMSTNEMHKVLSELLRLSDSAGWKVPNPWHSNNNQHAVMH